MFTEAPSGRHPVKPNSANKNRIGATTAKLIMVNSNS